MRIFLSGPMGVGKSALGPKLAEALSVPFFDLDQIVENRSGRSISCIFKESGEQGFRSLEAEILRSLVEKNEAGVFSLGGGTVTQRELRRWILNCGQLFSLTASIETLTERLSQSHHRPLLEGEENLSMRIETLIENRAEAYAECHQRFDTTDKDSSTLIQEMVNAAREKKVAVPLGSRTYSVYVGNQILSSGLKCIREEKAPSKIFLVQDHAIQETWGKEIERLVVSAGLTTVPISVAVSEAQKTIGTVEKIWDEVLSNHMDRTCWLLGVGGGVLGDLAAFSASTLMRGIRLGQFPTTLLSMVDSSVGGKTGFNRIFGKNLVGTFYQPRFVVCDVQCLSTLPQQELIAGMAEVVKSAWLAGEEQVSLVEQLADRLVQRDRDALIAAIEMSVQLKANIVAKDEQEAGARMLLNLGHTLGHALEADGKFTRYRHGEAVSLGMVAAFKISEKLGLLNKGESKRLKHLLQMLGLPVDLENHLNEHVLSFLTSDKKRHQDSIQFVLPKSPGHHQIEHIGISEIFELLGH